MAVVHQESPGNVGPEVWSDCAGWHAWWQCQLTWDLPSQLAPRLWVDQPGCRGPITQALEADVLELRHLGHPDADAVQKDIWLYQVNGHEENRSSRPDSLFEFRNHVRSQVLCGQEPVIPRELPSRAVAEACFEEGELLALRLPEPATALLELSTRAFRAADDPVGALLTGALRCALLSRPELAHAPADLVVAREDCRQALAELHRRDPRLGDLIRGEAPKPSSGWRFWGSLIRDAVVLATVPAGPAMPPNSPARAAPAIARDIAASGHATAPDPEHAWSEPPDIEPDAWPEPPAIESEPADGRRGVVRATWAILAVAFTASVIAFTTNLVAISTLALVGVVIAGAAAVGTPLARWVGAVFRIADGRGVETLRPSQVHLTATVRPTSVNLRVDLRSLAGLHRLLTRCAVHAIRFLRRRPRGYVAKVDARGPVPRLTKWVPDASASNSWWMRGNGPAHGAVLVGPRDAGQLWENILTASLGPGARGRVWWHRLQLTAARSLSAAEPGRVAVNAPPAWRTELERDYRARPDLRLVAPPAASVVYHVMGRTVATSAGARLDISGDASAGTRADQLLGANDLAANHPALVVLQAEPVDESIDVEVDDARERLILASELIEAGVPGVLCIPGVQLALLPAIVSALGDHAATEGSTCGALDLTETIKNALKDKVDASVLDGILLTIATRV
jgi:hypothetical protein